MAKTRKTEIKKRLLILWLILSLGWVMFSWNVTKVGDAFRAYQSMMTYENMIIDGNRSESMRSAYMRSTDRANESSQYIVLFLLMGFALPWLVLATGNWLINKRK